MKILYISQLLPYPLDTGGKIKAFKTIQALAKKHKVYLVCFVYKKAELKHRKEMEKICQKVKVFVWPLTRRKFKKLKTKLFFNFFSLKPFIFYRYFNPQMKKYVNNLLQKDKFDVIHIAHLNMTQYLPKKKNCLWIFEEHNIESEGKWSIAKYERFPINIIFYWEAIRLWLMERKWLKRFTWVLAISGRDKQIIISRGVNKNKVLTLPLATKARSLFSWGQKSLLFIGLLSWWPNKDALIWFINNLYFRLKEKIPGLKFYLVGAQPQPKLKKVVRNDQSIILTGYVKNINSYLKKAGCFILPFRMGSGVRIKLLMAMAAGIPVVGTKKGFEGFLTARETKSLLVADNKKKMTDYIVKVLNNKKFAQFISRKQLELIKEFYSQEEQRKVLDKIYGKK